MLITLSSKNKVGFIDGSTTKPSSTDSTYDMWNHYNNMVTQILNSLSQDFANNVIYVDIRVKIWSNLKERFSQLNTLHFLQIEREIISLRQEQLSIVTNYTRLKALWDELANLQFFFHIYVLSKKGLGRLSIVMPSHSIINGSK